MQPRIPRFFMGTSTENGFCGFPRDLYETDETGFAFLIKSGPGTGKSTLLRALAADFRKQGETVEEFSCSSDPDSLDGIRLSARRVCVFDATAPHVIEPSVWGVKEETVSLGVALDLAALAAKREDIASAGAETAAAHARARRFLAGVADLRSDRETLLTRALDPEKAAAVAARLTKTELSAPAYSCAFAGVQRRFLSAVTPRGVLSYPETVPLLCPRVIALDDPFSVAAKTVLNTLFAAVKKRGLPVLFCPDPLCPADPAHLLLPSLGVAFITADNRFTIQRPARTLHLKRCYDEAALKANKNRTAFDKKAERALLSAAVEALRDAKIAHDLLEIPYKSAMDFKKVESAKTALYQRISAFSPQA